MAISTRKVQDDGETILIDVYQDADSDTPVSIWDVSASGVKTFEVLELWWSCSGLATWTLEVNNTTNAVLWTMSGDSNGYVNFLGNLNHIGAIPGLTQTGHATDGDLLLHSVEAFTALDSIAFRVRCRKLT